MKFIPFLFLLFSVYTAKTQEVANYGGGEYEIQNHTCLSEEQRSEIIATLEQKYKESPSLQQYGKDKSKLTSFILPVRDAEDLDNESFYAISNYVDHDPLSSGEHNAFIKDYTCGFRSYDLGSGYDHTGTDIFSWPFPWKKMDEDVVEIIAADAGMIIYRADGNYDRNCSFCTYCQWNAVYLMHANGNVSWYGHLKENSVTGKTTGDMVEKGEYLGIMGSSGSSTGPHLHFEIWEDNSYTKLLDPYEGPCNDLNSQGLWDDQEDYRVPRVMDLGTGVLGPVPQGCGEQWETNFNQEFAPGERIFFSAYFRDQLNFDLAEHSVYDAEGALVDIWFQEFTNTFNASWWWFERTYSPNFAQGTWTYEIRYQSDVKTHEFIVGEVSSAENVFDQEFRFINDHHSKIIELVNKGNQDHPLSCAIINITGQVVYQNEFKNNISINSQALNQGVYILHLSDPVNHTQYSKRFFVM
jgi:hypothetical protein